MSERGVPASRGTPLQIAMIGSVPTHWGGGAGWRGGGVASHVSGLLSVLAQEGVSIRLLGDNTDSADLPSFPDLGPHVTFQAMARQPWPLTRLGLRRLFRLGWRMASRSDLRSAAPPAQLARFWGQVANYEHFFASGAADLLHIHRAYHRQFLCQQVLGVALPLVVTVHSVNLLVRSSPAWMRSMITDNYRRADQLIAVSHYVRDKITGYGADPERIIVIPNGVDVGLFAPGPCAQARETLRLPRKEFVILFSGNLVARKGVDVLIRAFGRLAARQPHARLVVIGKGEEEENLRTLSRELEVAGRVDFVGYQPFAQMSLWYRASDVFVMPSWAEGLSMAILEAMASGKPVISTHPEVGVHDAVVPEETGLLVNYGEVEQLAQALERLCADPGLSGRLGSNARRLVEQEFHWPIIGRRTADLYRSVLARPCPRRAEG